MTTCLHAAAAAANDGSDVQLFTCLIVALSQST
jgi:hypothetical protein